MKKLVLSGLAVVAIVLSTMAIAPKGNDIYCGVTSQSDCDDLLPNKAISPIPTQEQGFCVVTPQQSPCALVYLVDQP